MSCKVEKIGANKAKLTIEVDNKKYLECEDKAFNNSKSKLSAPGFRKGKVTKEMAFKIYGRESFAEDAINICINDTYYDELVNIDVKVISSPKINVVQFGVDKNLIYEAEVAIVPDFKLGNYKGISIKKTEVKITDEDVNKRIEEEREKNARLVSVDRKSKNGDTVTINFDGYVDGKQFNGGKAENYELVLGSKSFIDNFEDQLIDKSAGDELDVNVTFPESYGEKSLAGKPAVFKVKINEVKEKQLPDIDDEFVSEISEFETLKEYKEDIKKSLTATKEKQAKEIDKGKLLDEIYKNTTIDLADEAIESETVEMLNDYDRNLRYQGLTLKTYLEYLKKTEDDLKKDFKPRAERKIKNSLILEKIAKDEKIEVSQELIDEEMSAMATAYGMDVEQFKKNYSTPESLDKLKNDLLFPATLDFIYKNAKLS